jgi:hypothetical protein
LRAAKVAEVLFQKRSAPLTELASAFASEATLNTAEGLQKLKLGKNILEDYKTVNIGQSAYFTGEQFCAACGQLPWLLRLRRTRA